MNRVWSECASMVKRPVSELLLPKAVKSAGVRWFQPARPQDSGLVPPGTQAYVNLFVSQISVFIYFNLMKKKHLERLILLVLMFFHVGCTEDEFPSELESGPE